MRAKTPERWVRTPASQSIAGYRYDPELRHLDIRFTSSTKRYRYLDVPWFVYNGLRIAESKGRFVNGVVKPNYACEKL